MAILSEHLRQTKTVTDANGDHIKLSRWTHADSVYLSNGLTLDESVVYLKQADWDALGDEKYTNNVEYRITDATSEVHGSVVGVKGDAESSYRDGEVNITAENIGLGNVPNVATNDQAPTYTVATSNTTLTSGEKLSVAFGKIAKAISSLISHLADTVSHITSSERTKWDGYGSSISTLNTNLQTIENFTLTPAASDTPYFNYGTYNVATREVHINFISNFATPLTGSVPIATVPEKYRPRANRFGIGFIRLTTEASGIAANTSCHFDVLINGQIRQRMASGSYSQAGFSISYYI